MKKILAALLVCVMFSGCAIFQPYANLSAKDKAIVGVEVFSSWYNTTHDELDVKVKTGTPAEREYIVKNISPKMNKIKPLVVKYDKLVLLWQETNMKPEGVEGVVSEIQTLMLGVIKALK